MNTFSIPLAQLAEKMKLDLTTVVSKATLEVFGAVVRKSPVDTGRFRANWNVSYGTPSLSVTAGVDPTHSVRELAKVPALPVGGVTFLSNALPYARKLEYGYSKQAPAGMVRLTAMEFDDYVRKAIATQ